LLHPLLEIFLIEHIAVKDKTRMNYLAAVYTLVPAYFKFHLTTAAAASLESYCRIEFITASGTSAVAIGGHNKSTFAVRATVAGEHYLVKVPAGVRYKCLYRNPHFTGLCYYIHHPSPGPDHAEWQDFRLSCPYHKSVRVDLYPHGRHSRDTADFGV